MDSRPVSVPIRPPPSDPNLLPAERSKLKQGRYAEINEDGSKLFITKDDVNPPEEIDINGVTPEIDNVNNKIIYTVEIPDQDHEGNAPKIDTYIIDKNGNYVKKSSIPAQKIYKLYEDIDISNPPQGPLDYTIPINEYTIRKENNDLLEIFDQGINEIVLRLKARFGQNNKDVNEVVKAISGIFTHIDEIITPHTGNTSNDDYAENLLVSKKDEDTGVYISEIEDGMRQKEYIENPESQISFEQVNDSTNMKDIKTLDYKEIQDKYTTLYHADPNHEFNNINLNKTEDLAKLESRLSNCQALEIFHLKLYENFMKTGAFTLTLYEKYKYVTHVMLYLFKNLVNKPKTEVDNGCVEPMVRLPKTIIKNIASLVEEQGRIQGTIDTINEGLKETQMEKMYNYGMVNNIKPNVLNTETPDLTSGPYIKPLKTNKDGVEVPEVNLENKVGVPDVIDESKVLPKPLIDTLPGV